jgi:hypothetical protein
MHVIYGIWDIYDGEKKLIAFSQKEKIVKYYIQQWNLPFKMSTLRFGNIKSMEKFTRTNRSKLLVVIKRDIDDLENILILTENDTSNLEMYSSRNCERFVGEYEEYEKFSLALKPRYRKIINDVGFTVLEHEAIYCDIRDSSDATGHYYDKINPGALEIEIDQVKLFKFLKNGLFIYAD